ncbi:MAG: ACT domain-containing protein, partial [Planctomycetaceae bacterium]
IVVSEVALDRDQSLVSQWRGVELKSDESIDKWGVLGIGLRTPRGVGQKLFQALAGAGVNVKIISTSEVCISTVLDAGAGEQALRAVQQAFGHR